MLYACLVQDQVLDVVVITIDIGSTTMSLAMLEHALHKHKDELTRVNSMFEIATPSYPEMKKPLMKKTFEALGIALWKKPAGHKDVVGLAAKTTTKGRLRVPPCAVMKKPAFKNK